MHHAKCLLFGTGLLAFCVLSPLLIGSDSSSYLYKVLPEVIWAPATGGGVWTSDVQITDITGGSTVSAFFCYGGGDMRGGASGFVLMNGLAAGRSAKIANVLSFLQGLDSGFTYYGRVGALFLQTQDSSHKIHAVVRTYNGNYSKTLPGISPIDSNTARQGRNMVIHNLTNNSTYRSTVGFFNWSPTDPVLVDFYLRDSSGAQIGNSFTKNFAVADYKAFSPFTEAGVPYPGSSFDNVWLQVVPDGGSGELVCFGASANNATNDPASHVAVQAGGSYYNSPGGWTVIPEAIWAPATGGGTWITDVQITDMTGGAQVYASFNYGGGLKRSAGEDEGFLLWTSPGQYSSVKITNLLQALQNIDPGFNYFGRVGSVDFGTADPSQKILVSARTYNGNYSKTFPCLNWSEANIISETRPMLIQDLTNNAVYRSTIGLFNLNNPCVLEFRLIGGDGSQVGSTFTKSLVFNDFTAFSPYAEAGIPYPGYSHDNIYLRIQVISGTDVETMCFGASANNTSNDPAAHIAVVRD